LVELKLAFRSRRRARRRGCRPSRAGKAGGHVVSFSWTWRGATWMTCGRLRGRPLRRPPSFGRSCP